MPENSSNIELRADVNAGPPGGINSLPLQIRHKIALSFVLLLIVVTTAFWLLFQNELNRSINEYSDILGASLAEQTAASVRELVLVNDLIGLNVVLTQLVRNDNILFASVHDVDNLQLSSAGQRNNLQEDSTVYTADITVQEAIAGSVRVQLDTLVVNNYRSRMRNLFLLVLGVALVLVITTAFALAGLITSPLRNLIDTINSNTEPEPDIVPAVDETGQLQTAVENLLARYQEMEEQLLETGVWQRDHSHDELEPARMTASVLVVKVVNVHTAIELLHPATLSGLLQEYLFYLNQAACLYGGEFHRIHGESVVVCFDEFSCEHNHSINALYCAGLFQSIMARVNGRHRKKGEQILEFRMAIHSGDIFMAPGLATQDQPARNAILGKTLDITYFLSKQCAANELVISEASRSHARNFEDFETHQQREVSMPADNVSFMAYILTSGFAEDMGMIRQQRQHILGSSKQVVQGPSDSL